MVPPHAAGQAWSRWSGWCECGGRGGGPGPGPGRVTERRLEGGCCPLSASVGVLRGAGRCWGVLSC